MKQKAVPLPSRASLQCAQGAAEARPAPGQTAVVVVALGQPPAPGEQMAKLCPEL